MKKILLILSLLTSVAHAQFDTRSIETKVINGVFGFRNMITNPSCKRNVASITGSSVAAVRNTTTPLDGISDCTWNPTATSQTLTFAYDSLPAGLKGQNCEARIAYLGDASLVKANVQINSVNVASDLQLTNSGTNAAVASILYPCGDGSTATTLVLTSTGDAANVQYAVYGGQVTNLTSSYNVTSWTSYTPTYSAGFGTVTGSSLQYRLVGNVLEIQGSFATGTTAASSGSFTLPSGYVIDFTKIPSTMVVGNITRNVSSTALTYFSMLAISGNSTTSVYFGGPLGESNANAPFSTPNMSAVAGNSETMAVRIAVPVTGMMGGTVINANMVGSYYSGYHDSTCAWARTNVAYGAFTADASCALAQRQASGIGAVATGSVLPALALTLPATGTYYVCAYVNSYAAGNGGLRITDGTTVIAEANDQSTTRTTKALCGSYVASSLTPTISIEGKSSSGAINIDTSSTNTAIEWTIFPVTNNMPQPVFVGSVSSQATGALRFEYLQFGGGASGGLATSSCTSTPCTIASQSGSWISSVARGSAGSYTATIASGIFSSVPYCVGNAGLFGVATGGFANVNATNATTINVNAYSNAGTTLTDNVITLYCFGPR